MCQTYRPKSVSKLRFCEKVRWRQRKRYRLCRHLVNILRIKTITTYDFPCDRAWPYQTAHLLHAALLFVQVPCRFSKPRILQVLQALGSPPAQAELACWERLIFFLSTWIKSLPIPEAINTLGTREDHVQPLNRTRQPLARLTGLAGCVHYQISSGRPLIWLDREIS